jgi:hypothetical protein
VRGSLQARRYVRIPICRDFKETDIAFERQRPLIDEMLSGQGLVFPGRYPTRRVVNGLG